MTGPLGELLATDERQALEFFLLRLKDVSGAAVDQAELLYHASVLAHHALISTHAHVDVSSPSGLGVVFDHFVCDTSLWHDSLLMETAGAQCLVLAGFFEDQMRRRHNIHWYAELGASFFRRAAAQERSERKAWVLGRVAMRFEWWRRRYARLSRELRDGPYLLTLSGRPDA